MPLDEAELRRRRQERHRRYQQRPEVKARRNEQNREYRARLGALAARAASYGLPASALSALLAAGCAICGDTAHRLEVDHDHACCPGRGSCGACVRGVLCGPCNRTLGAALDNPARLRALADYLERPACRTA